MSDEVLAAKMQNFSYYTFELLWIQRVVILRNGFKANEKQQLSSFCSSVLFRLHSHYPSGLPAFVSDGQDAQSVQMMVPLVAGRCQRAISSPFYYPSVALLSLPHLLSVSLSVLVSEYFPCQISFPLHVLLVRISVAPGGVRELG